MYFQVKYIKCLCPCWVSVEWRGWLCLRDVLLVYIPFVCIHLVFSSFSDVRKRNRKLLCWSKSSATLMACSDRHHNRGTYLIQDKTLFNLLYSVQVALHAFAVHVSSLPNNVSPTCNSRPAVAVTARWMSFNQEIQFAARPWQPPPACDSNRHLENLSLYADDEFEIEARNSWTAGTERPGTSHP